MKSFVLPSIKQHNPRKQQQHSMEKKKRNFDFKQRLYTRTCVCIFAFVAAILILLHYTSKDPSSLRPYFNHNPILISHRASSSRLILEEKRPFHGELTSGHRKSLAYSSPDLLPDELKLSDSSTAIPRNMALQGLGTVFVRGTAAVDELVVAHVEEDASLQDLRLFLRTFHRSGMSAKADLVFIFSSDRFPEAADRIIYQESTYLKKLLTIKSPEIRRSSSVFPSDNFKINSTFLNFTISKFNQEAFDKVKASSEPIWGSDDSSNFPRKRTDFKDLEIGLGSIVGFEASELNPDDNLQGFIDNPPLQLRRWACYQMLLGMVRNKFKHVLLTSVSGVLIFSDPKVMTSRKAGVYLSLQYRTWGSSPTETDSIGSDVVGDTDLVNAHIPPPNIDAGKSAERRIINSSYVKNAQHKKHIKQHAGAEKRVHSSWKNTRKVVKKGSYGTGTDFEHVYGSLKWEAMDDAEKNCNMVTSAAIIGEMSLIRVMANTMVTEIVKVALERKHRASFPDNVLLSYLIHINSGVFGRKVLGNLYILENSRSFVHHVDGCNQPNLIFSDEAHQVYPMVAGNYKSRQWRHILNQIHQDICSSSKDYHVYSDCE